MKLVKTIRLPWVKSKLFFSNDGTIYFYGYRALWRIKDDCCVKQMDLALGPFWLQESIPYNGLFSSESLAPVAVNGGLLIGEYLGPIGERQFSAKLHFVSEYGERSWSCKLPGDFPEAVLAAPDDGAYILTIWDTSILRISKTGELLWQIKDIGKILGFGPIAEDGSQLYIISSPNNLQSNKCDVWLMKLLPNGKLLNVQYLSSDADPVWLHIKVLPTERHCLIVIESQNTLIIICSNKDNKIEKTLKLSGANNIAGISPDGKWLVTNLCMEKSDALYKANVNELSDWSQIQLPERHHGFWLAPVITPSGAVYFVGKHLGIDQKRNAGKYIYEFPPDNNSRFQSYKVKAPIESIYKHGTSLYVVQSKENRSFSYLSIFDLGY